MIRRHSRSAIFMHWSNAVCWLFLLFSGFALLDNPYMQPISQGWVDFWNGLVGGPYRLLSAHVIVGGVWVMLYTVYLLFRFKGEALPFLKEITDLHPASDMTWCVRKGLRLTIGEKLMRNMGMETELPAQSFYNAGQKLAAIAADPEGKSAFFFRFFIHSSMGSCASMTAQNMRIQPSASLTVRISCRSTQPASTANTDSRLIISVASVAFVRCCASI